MKEKSRLARRDDRRHLVVPSEDNSSCFEPSEDSLCDRYQRRQSDDDTSMRHGYGASSDPVMQRMMRRKQARQKRENAGLTTADSVAGYRGRDCSIEELIEYIDPKPPAVPKLGQKQASSRKKRKKKRGANRAATSDSGNVKSATPVGVGSSYKDAGVSSGKTSPEEVAEKTAASVDCSTGTANDPETHVSSADAEVDSEPLSELLLRQETISPMLTYEGSSSNASDADNVSDLHNNRTFRDYSHFPDDSVEMSSSGIRSERDCENYNRTVILNAEPYLPVAQSTETIARVNENEFGTSALDSSYAESSDSTVSIKETILVRDQDKESNISEADTQRRNEVAAEDFAPPVFLRVSEDAAVDSVDGSCVPHRNSQELSNTIIHQEIVFQSNNYVRSTQMMDSVDIGQSTSSSSTSDACDSQDLDSRSLVDDTLSDFDYRSIPASHESDFTVVTQKKKKNVMKQNVSGASCIQRTFYNRSLRDGTSVRDWQSSSRHETVNQSCRVRSAAAVTCSLDSGSTELHAVTVTRHTSSSRAASEFFHSPAHDKETVLDVCNLSSVACVDSSSSNAILHDALDVSRCCENSSRSPRSAPDAKRSPVETKPREKVFLDTRRPHVGISPASVISELSFYYDINVLENQSAVQTDDLTLSPVYSIQETGINSEDQFTSCSADSTNFPTPDANTSLPPCTSNANTVLYVDRRREQAVSLQSTADDSRLLLDNESRWLQFGVRPVTPVSDASQTCEQPGSTQSTASAYCVTLPSDVSSSSLHSTRSGNLISGTATGRLSPSVSATDSGRRSSSRGRQHFYLQAAQIFLYSGWY